MVVWIAVATHLGALALNKRNEKFPYMVVIPSLNELGPRLYSDVQCARARAQVPITPVQVGVVPAPRRKLTGAPRCKPGRADQFLSKARPSSDRGRTAV